jgi:hypothetical protein
MADDGRVRIELSFAGGQTLLVRLDPGEVERLEQVFAGGGTSTLVLRCADADLLLRPQDVTYVRRFHREAPVGY